jgi:hypothetical protein
MRSAYSNGTVFVDMEPMHIDDVAVTLVTQIKCRRNQRGKGHTSRYMRDVILPLADQEGAVLILAPQPDVSDMGLDYEDLVAWYERLGFVLRKSDGIMWRLPHATVNRSSNQTEFPDPRWVTVEGSISTIGRWHPDRYRSFRSA